MTKGCNTWPASNINDMTKAVAAVSISGPAFRITKKVIQEILKREVMETAYLISQRLGYRERKSGWIKN